MFKLLNIKRLFLFAGNEKNFTNLRFRTTSICRESAVYLWAMTLGSLSINLSINRTKKDILEIANINRYFRGVHTAYTNGVLGETGIPILEQPWFRDCVADIEP